MNCIFCKIIAGEIPSSKVYEDVDFIAILDIRPTNFGHTLVIPKQHFINVYDTPETVGQKIYPVLTKIANGIKNALNCDGINVVQNNEAAGGQEVFHSHIHLIPRFKDDGHHFGGEHNSYKDVEAMAAMAEKIAAEI